MTRRRSIRPPPGPRRAVRRRPGRALPATSATTLASSRSPSVAAALGVELDPQQSVARDDAGRTAAVRRSRPARCRRRSADGSAGVGVDEVGIGVRARCRRTADAPGRGDDRFQPMCGRRGASASTTSGPPAHRASRAVLVAAVEQQLQAEADAEERPVRGDPARGSARPAPGARSRSMAGAAGTDARHDDGIGTVEAVGVRGDAHAGADQRERLADADTRLPAP